MALGGNIPQDAILDVFKGIVATEVQQKGSVLGGVPMVEKLMGNKNYFDKIGKKSSYTKTSRGMPKQFEEMTVERRLVTERFISSDHRADVEELLKIVENPRSHIVNAMAFELGRQKDDVIMDAISGNAVVQTAGSTANKALTLSIAVNDHTYDAGAGDVALTASKLKKAKKLITEAYGSSGNEELIVIAPAGQLTELLTIDEVINTRFNPAQPLAGANTFASLSGYLGMQFIAYEDTGLDGSNDEKVFVLTKDAIMLGIWQDLTIKFGIDHLTVGDPEIISATMAIGAVRFDEEKVVVIACDPRKA